jgi:hypothetical protein
VRSRPPLMEYEVGKNYSKFAVYNLNETYIQLKENFEA